MCMQVIVQCCAPPNHCDCYSAFGSCSAAALIALWMTRPMYKTAPTASTTDTPTANMFTSSPALGAEAPCPATLPLPVKVAIISVDAEPMYRDIPDQQSCMTVRKGVTDGLSAKVKQAATLYAARLLTVHPCTLCIPAELSS